MVRAQALGKATQGLCVYRQCDEENGLATVRELPATPLWLSPRNAETLAQHHVAEEAKSSSEEPPSIPHAASAVRNIYIGRYDSKTQGI